MSGCSKNSIRFPVQSTVGTVFAGSFKNVKKQNMASALVIPSGDVHAFKQVSFLAAGLPPFQNVSL